MLPPGGCGWGLLGIEVAVAEPKPVVVVLLLLLSWCAEKTRPRFGRLATLAGYDVPLDVRLGAVTLK